MHSISKFITKNNKYFIVFPFVRQQFPDVENQAERYRTGMSTPSTDNVFEGAGGLTDSLYEIGKKCDRLRLYVGCWLHISRDMCGKCFFCKTIE